MPPRLSNGNLQIKDGLYGGEVFDFDMALMLVDLYQPELTHTLRKEIDPLEWAELIGNIGGTWGEQMFKLELFVAR